MTARTIEEVGAVAPAAFADARKTVGLFAVPRSGSMATDEYYGETAIPGPRPK